MDPTLFSLTLARKANHQGSRLAVTYLVTYRRGASLLCSKVDHRTTGYLVSYVVGVETHTTTVGPLILLQAFTMLLLIGAK
jgi:hypothetical protein